MPPSRKQSPACRTSAAPGVFCNTNTRAVQSSNYFLAGLLSRSQQPQRDIAIFMIPIEPLLERNGFFPLVCIPQPKQARWQAGARLFVPCMFFYPYHRIGANFPSKSCDWNNAGQEVLARAGNILVARAAFDMSVSLFGRNRVTARLASDLLIEARREVMGFSSFFLCGDFLETSV
jgi:hypothetical protein